jgi:hypothetical protein
VVAPEHEGAAEHAPPPPRPDRARRLPLLRRAPEPGARGRSEEARDARKDAVTGVTLAYPDRTIALEKNAEATGA